jgi:hypothetical protein
VLHGLAVLHECMDRLDESHLLAESRTTMQQFNECFRFASMFWILHITMFSYVGLYAPFCSLIGHLLANTSGFPSYSERSLSQAHRHFPCKRFDVDGSLHHRRFIPRTGMCSQSCKLTSAVVVVEAIVGPSK